MSKCGTGLLCLGAALAAFGEEAASPVYKPLSVGALSEFGQLQGGRYDDRKPFDKDWVDHFAAQITQEVVVDERLSIAVGIGGVFEFQKPEEINPNWGGTQYKNFFHGPSVARLTYTRPLGSEWKTAFTLGQFPYKYNPEASNLGEYLFRSGAYPTYLMTGGYATVNNSGTFLQGGMMSLTKGGTQFDLFVTTETGMPPLYDVSVAGVATQSLADGLLTLGAGFNLKRILSVRPSKTTPKNFQNAYFTVNGRDYVGQESYYLRRASYYRNRETQATDAGDAAGAAVWAAKAKAVEDDAALVNAVSTDSIKASRSYFTNRAAIVMARATVDFKKLLPSEAFGANDLKLYAETALLGITNYPVFYAKRTERMPVMVGFTLPTFRWLDLLALEVESFRSPWINSFEESGVSNNATPQIPSELDTFYSKEDFNDIVDRDNTSFSVLLKKEMVPGITLSAQVARDHLRLVSVNSWFGYGVNANETLGRSSDWYWMVQFGFGI